MKFPGSLSNTVTKEDRTHRAWCELQHASMYGHAKTDWSWLPRHMRWDDMKPFVQNLMTTAVCTDCRLHAEDVTRLDLDHRWGVVKSGGVTRLARRGDCDWRAVSREIRKCDLVCRDCHNIREREREFKRDAIGIPDFNTLPKRTKYVTKEQHDDTGDIERWYGVAGSTADAWVSKLKLESWRISISTAGPEMIPGCRSVNGAPGWIEVDARAQSAVMALRYDAFTSATDVRIAVELLMVCLMLGNFDADIRDILATIPTEKARTSARLVYQQSFDRQVRALHAVCGGTEEAARGGVNVIRNAAGMGKSQPGDAGGTEGDAEAG